ncbi:Gfo/Idh/MocA family oxidoreductase [Streptosporangiaceae bacterium NEAU-GS5]|nr:Gfo/Idh/MocA family oxidoreductase [Streptosporangiaceae bacterium NEAU-GS5]
MKVALLGLGAVAQAVYLPLLTRRRDLFEIAAVCDLDPAHAASFGLPWYDDPYAMLAAGGFDAVIVISPGSHGALVAAALELGYWVLCEKPLAYSKAEAEAIDKPERLMVAYMKQYDPAVQRMAEQLGDTPIRHLETRVLHPTEESQLLFARVRGARPQATAIAPFAEADERALDAALGDPDTVSGPETYALEGPDALRDAAAARGAHERLRRLYAQVVLGSMVHDISLMRLLAGSPEIVDHAAVWPVATFPPSVEVTGALPDNDGRFALRWHFLPSYPAYRQTLAVHHDHGSLRADFPSPYLLNAPTTLTITARVGTTEQKTVYREVSEAFERQLAAFHRFVTEGEPPISGRDEAVRDITTAQRIIRRYAALAGLPIGGECADP